MKRTTTLLAGTLGSLTLTASAQTHTLQVVPEGTAGNQAFGGSLGQEFNVVSPITVTKLGCFDDLSDGLQLTIRVQLYDRTAPAAPLLDMEFLPDDPETPVREDGELIGGGRFLPTVSPLNLPAGFQGMIVASGYGAGERNGNLAAPLWTQDDGGGLISFADRRSFWGDPGAVPVNADASNQYAAGNFEYQANGGLQPGAPAPVLVNGNGQVQLTWAAVTQPVAAASYRILRAASISGPFTQIALVTTTSHIDTGLTNGTVYYYKMLSVTAGGTLSSESPVLSATPFQLPADQHIAYFTPGNVTGNQSFGGALGMDFDVQNTVTVTWLGVYDSGSNGIQPDPGADSIAGNEDDIPRVLSARIYNRDTQEVLASQDFTTEAPGTLVAGMRLIQLSSPVELPTGFHGVIVADGYGAGEPLRNSGGIAANAVWTLDDGQSSLLFTGTGRYGLTAGAFPDVVDASLPAAYAAGTFQYRTTAAAAPGKPVARLNPVISNAAASLSWEAVTAPVAAVKYRVYRYDPDLLTYTQAGETTALSLIVTGLTNDLPATFVVRAVSAAGVEGLASDFLTTTPSAPMAGAAYVVPEGTFGNQSFGGSLGMDFNVVNAVKITKLGAFDSAGDGLLLPITVAIFDRTTGNAVTPLMEFPVDDPGTAAREDGELDGGSRFLPLSPAVVLPAGFQGSVVAYGYGVDEPNGNTGGGSWSTFSGGSFVFTGSSRWDTAQGVLPANIDGGPANKFAAGTFYFEPEGAAVTTFDAGLAIALQAGNQVRLTWTPTVGAVLQRSPDLKTWSAVTGAAPGFVTPVAGREYFRLAKP